jgi:hypothetical protein
VAIGVLFFHALSTGGRGGAMSQHLDESPF